MRFVLVAMLFLSSCVSRQNQMQNTESHIRYFTSFAGYSIPFKPTGEVSTAETQAMDSYYIGRYEGKQLISFEKMEHGKRTWFDQYVYWPDGKHLKHRHMTKEDGSVVEQDFDRKGKMVAKF
jgi:hypothetical protein